MTSAAFGVAAVVAALRPWGIWTDRHGVVHIRSTGTGRTFCGVDVGHYTNTSPSVGCDGCVTASIADYARTHVCGGDCVGGDPQ
jgi:hypothetical protein